MRLGTPVVVLVLMLALRRTGESEEGGDVDVGVGDEADVVERGEIEKSEETGVSCEADFLIFSLSFSSFGLTNVGVVIVCPEDPEEGGVCDEGCPV